MAVWNYEEAKKEKTEIDRKAAKMSRFIGRSDGFLRHNKQEQESIKIQCEVLWLYSEALEKIIDVLRLNKGC